jgi:tryptophan synthase alpha subunit
MGYFNPMLQWRREFLQCAEIGIDGLIIPDFQLMFMLMNTKPFLKIRPNQRVDYTNF